MTRPRIVNHATEIAEYTAGVKRARDEYALHPFMTRTAPCPGTCGGYVVWPYDLKPQPCTPCANQQERATH